MREPFHCRDTKRYPYILFQSKHFSATYCYIAFGDTILPESFRIQPFITHALAVTERIGWSELQARKQHPVHRGGQVTGDVFSDSPMRDEGDCTQNEAVHLHAHSECLIHTPGPAVGWHHGEGEGLRLVTPIRSKELG